MGVTCLKASSELATCIFLISVIQKLWYATEILKELTALAIINTILGYSQVGAKERRQVANRKGMSCRLLSWLWQ